MLHSYSTAPLACLLACFRMAEVMAFVNPFLWVFAKIFYHIIPCFAMAILRLWIQRFPLLSRHFPGPARFGKQFECGHTRIFCRAAGPQKCLLGSSPNPQDFGTKCLEAKPRYFSRVLFFSGFASSGGCFSFQSSSRAIICSFILAGVTSLPKYFESSDKAIPGCENQVSPIFLVAPCTAATLCQ